ncbi:MAG: DUF6106 family protein [Agathobacter sp.]
MKEVYVIVPVKRSAGMIAAAVLTLVLAVIFLLLTCVMPAALLIGIIFAVIWYFLTFRSYKEYEYSYFDGELHFARVMNKSRRKQLGSYSMEDVVLIAPSGDRSVYRYENDNQVKVKDYSSRHKEHSIYCAVIQQAGNTTLIKFEPDSDYLDAVEVKFKQKVTRRSEQ